MSRRTSHAPSPHLHDMTRTWTNTTNGSCGAPGEITSGGLSYAELCKLHEVRDWTDTKKKVERVDVAQDRPVPDMGLVCPDCFVQVPRGVFSCDVCGN